MNEPYPIQIVLSINGGYDIREIKPKHSQYIDDAIFLITRYLGVNPKITPNLYTRGDDVYANAFTNPGDKDNIYLTDDLFWNDADYVIAVIVHEILHTLGYEHDDATKLMNTSVPEDITEEDVITDLRALIDGEVNEDQNWWAQQDQDEDFVQEWENSDGNE